MENVITKVFSEMHVGDRLHDFYYYALVKSRFDYIIIIPRKCLTEYKCLCTQYSDMDLRDDKCYMTSKSYIRYKEQMLSEIREGKDISVLIIDDIMMYGRGIKALLKEILEDLDKPLRDAFISKIHVSVFIENASEYEDKNSDWVKAALEEILEDRYNRYFSYKNPRDINRASDLFLESFYASATSNTSFVNTWYCRDNDFIDFSAEKEEIKINDLKIRPKGLQHVIIKSNEDQRRNAFFSCVYYEKQDKQCEPWAEFKCVRVYYNQKLNRAFLVPYVFLKPMSGEQIDNILYILKELLISVNLWSELGNTDQAYILKFEYLTNLLSDCYGAFFYNHYLNSEHSSWNELFEEEMISADFSFGQNNVLHMNELCQKQTDHLWEEITRRCNEIFKQEYAFFEQEEGTADLFMQVIMQIIKQGIKQDEQCEKIMRTILDKANIKDTSLAKDGQGKFFGITTLSMRKVLEQTGNLSPDKPVMLYRELIRHMDQGSASLKIEKLKKNTGRYYGAIMNSGEQAYRIFQEPAALALHYFAEIEENCINLFIKSETEKKIKEFIEAYENTRLPDMISSEELELIRQGIRERKAKYSDYDVVRKNNDSDQRLREKFEQAYKWITY